MCQLTLDVSNTCLQSSYVLIKLSQEKAATCIGLQKPGKTHLSDSSLSICHMSDYMTKHEGAVKILDAPITCSGGSRTAIDNI